MVIPCISISSFAALFVSLFPIIPMCANTVFNELQRVLFFLIFIIRKRDFTPDEANYLLVMEVIVCQVVLFHLSLLNTILVPVFLGYSYWFGCSFISYMVWSSLSSRVFRDCICGVTPQSIQEFQHQSIPS